MPIVRGEIVLPATGAPATAANVIVRVEDISRADAPTVIVGEQRQSDVSLSPGTALPFAVEIPGERVDSRRMYSVSVHIDVSGSGEIERGDLISTQIYPVLTRGHGDEARVQVKRV